MSLRIGHLRYLSVYLSFKQKKNIINFIENEEKKK